MEDLRTAQIKKHTEDVCKSLATMRKMTSLTHVNIALKNAIEEINKGTKKLIREYQPAEGEQMFLDLS